MLNKNPEFINIYELIDPRDELPRYIGYTKLDLSIRLKRHFRASCNQHKVNWFNLLRSQGLKPIISLIEKVPNGKHKFFERYWISQYRTWGFDLLNATIGGDGIDDPSGKIAKLIGDRQRGVPNKPISEETRNKLRLSQLGRKKSPEAIRRRLESERKNRLENPERYVELDRNRMIQLRKKPYVERNWGNRKGVRSKPILAIMPNCMIVSYYDNAQHVKESIPSLCDYSRVHILGVSRNNGSIRDIQLSYA